MRKIYLFGLLLVGLGGLFSLRAEVGDFAFRTNLPFSAPVSDLVVAQDRFLIALDSSRQELIFFDTWNWEEMTPSPALELGGSVVAMDLNPSASRLYLAYTDGTIRWIELDPIYLLEFGDPISSASLQIEEGTTIFSGNTINDLLVIQNWDEAGVDCLFMEIKEGETSSLNWAMIRGESISNSGGPLITGSSVELTKTDYRLYTKHYYDINTFFNSFICESSYTSQFQIAYESDNFQGLDVEDYNFSLVTGNKDAKEIWLYDAYTGDFEDSYKLISQAPNQIWVKRIYGEEGVLVFFNEEGILKAIKIISYHKFQTEAPVQILDFNTTELLIMADASSEDGYLYFAPQGSSTVSVISANPGIYNLTLDPGTTIEQEQFKISFETDTGKYYTISTCAQFAISPGECEKTIAQGEITTSPTTITITSSEVGEGEFILGIFVRDAYLLSYHQARTATKIIINLPPLAQDFSLKFGDEKIFIKFKSQSAQDIARYIIYYGTNDSAPLDQPELLDDTGGDGNPPSPLIINQPEPGKDYELKITGLTNGERYYVQILTEDTSGLNSLSERKSTIPQETITLTEMEGEEGGFDCLGSISPVIAPSPSEVSLGLIPLALLLGLKIFQRRKK